VKKEAEAAAELAIALAKGDTAAADALATGKVEDTTAKTQVPSVLLEPQPIYKDTVKDVIADGFTTKDKICTTAELKAACTANGIS
jgi:D-xylose transport system substrate-binding protein